MVTVPSLLLSRIGSSCFHLRGTEHTHGQNYLGLRIFGHNGSFRGYLGFGRLAGFFSGAGKGTCWVASRIWHSLVPKPSLFSRTQSTNDQIYAHHTQYMCIIWPFVIVYPDRMSIGLKYHQSHRPLCILVYSLLCTYSALYVYLCTINYCVLLSESWLCVHPNFLVLELRLASVMIPVYMYVSLLSPLTLVGGANLLRMI